MATLIAVKYKGKRLVPHGEHGWKIDGVYHPDLQAAIGYVNDQVQEKLFKDESLGHRMEREETRGERVAERRMRKI